MAEPSPEAALADIAKHLRRLGKPFAVVGGLAISVRAEVRFTRDVDLAIAPKDDGEVERLVGELRGHGYEAVTVVEHVSLGRLAIVRLESPSGWVVDLLAASSGIEAEIVARATPVPFEGIGDLPVARPEELLAMKVLSMTEHRLQDRIDAVNLVLSNEDLALDEVKDDLRRITERGFHLEQDLEAKLQDVLTAARNEALA